MTVTSAFPILLTRDLPRLADFYEAALDGEVTFRFPGEDGDDYVGMQVGGASLGIGRDPDAGAPGAADRIALWFYVDDVDSAYARFAAAGGAGVRTPQDMPWGERVALARDVDGNLVNLGAPVA